MTTQEMQDSYWQDYLPMALECGMTPTQFWEGEPRLLNSYIIKHERELDEYNYKSWLLNVYTYKAVSTALSQMFADKKDIQNNDIKYFEKPLEEFCIYGKKENKEEKEKTINKTHRNRVNYWAKFGKKGGK